MINPLSHYCVTAEWHNNVTNLFFDFYLVLHNMKTRSFSKFFIIGTTILTLFQSSVWASLKTPTEDLRPVVDKLLTVLSDQSLKGTDKVMQRRDAIMGVIREGFDFREMSKRVLGKTWREIGNVQQDRFTELMTEFLKNVYIGKIEGYTEGQKVEYASEDIKGDRAQVSTFLSNNGNKISLYYIMKDTPEKWMVYDINIEGVSLVRNYQEQFKSILRTDKYDGLVKVLEQKNQEFLKGAK